MTIAYIAIGSNVNAAKNYASAVREIAGSTLLVGISEPNIPGCTAGIGNDPAETCNGKNDGQSP